MGNTNILESDFEYIEYHIESNHDLIKYCDVNNTNPIIHIHDKAIDFPLTVNKNLFFNNNIKTLRFCNCIFNFPLVIQWTEREKLDFFFEFQECEFEQELNIRRTECANLNLIQCIFNNDVKIEISKFDYLRLSGSVFNSDFLLLESSINNIITWGLNGKAKYNGSVQFCYLNVLYANFKDACFAKDLYIQDVTFKGNAVFAEIEVKGKLTLCSSFFMEKSKNDEKYELSQFEIIGKGFFEKMKIHEMEIQYVSFENSLYFNDSNIDLLKIHNIHINKDFHFRGLTANCSDQETACFLKDQATRQNDKILAIEMKAQEIAQYRKWLLNNSKWHKLLRSSDWWMLELNIMSNKNGTDWGRGTLFTIGIWILCFSWYIIARDGWGATFIFSDKEYLKESIEYLWLLNGIEDLSKQDWNKISICAPFPYFVGKILIAYGIYQTISAFRKHNH